MVLEMYWAYQITVLMLLVCAKHEPGVGILTMDKSMAVIGEPLVLKYESQVAITKRVAFTVDGNLQGVCEDRYVINGRCGSGLGHNVTRISSRVITLEIHSFSALKHAGTWRVQEGWNTFSNSLIIKGPHRSVGILTMDKSMAVIGEPLVLKYESQVAITKRVAFTVDGNLQGVCEDRYVINGRCGSGLGHNVTRISSRVITLEIHSFSASKHAGTWRVQEGWNTFSNSLIIKGPHRSVGILTMDKSMAVIGEPLVLKYESQVAITKRVAFTVDGNLQGACEDHYVINGRCGSGLGHNVTRISSRVITLEIHSFSASKHAGTWRVQEGWNTFSNSLIIKGPHRSVGILTMDKSMAVIGEPLVLKYESQVAITKRVAFTVDGNLQGACEDHYVINGRCGSGLGHNVTRISSRVITLEIHSFSASKHAGTWRVQEGWNTFSNSLIIKDPHRST
ncbi:uncharacterized protein LOC121386139 [Gigantopelta aegis]|uniref:uncharacterized protein LOC121386139 n=1 Tax=Gigantopelta aegis TaxID=1735272 RepID=UPI001B88C751|nr:uncharacterized protein LOC121386139 [Gigantopelta aegis]